VGGPQQPAKHLRDRSRRPRGAASRSLAVWSVLLLAAGAVVVPIAATPASAATIGTAPTGTAPNGTAPTATTPVGTAPVLPAQAAVQDAVPANDPLQLTVVLQPRDPAGLASLAQSVATPGSPDYRMFLAPGGFAQRFGPTDATIAAVQASLSSLGLHPGALSGNRLAIPITTTAGRAASALGIHLRHVRLAGGRIAYANDAAPRLPAQIAKAVQGIIGLDDLTQDHPTWRPAPRPTTAPTAEPTATPTQALATPAIPANAAPTTTTPATTGPQPCAAAVSAGNNWGGYTANQIAQGYSFNGLYAKNTLGTGVTIALYELATYNASDIAAFQACYGTSAPITNINVDGGARPGDGGAIEVELDIEGAISMAPKASIAVYSGPNGSGTYDTYNRIVSDGTAKVVSTSWGNCEAARTATQVSNENTLFQQAAVQGQTILASAGDNGSEDCSTGTALSVDDPSAQPFVTSVGGTNLTAVGPPPAETVWNEAAGQFGAGGGGISRFWPMPAAQHGPGVINSYSTPATCGAPAGAACRQVPDVSGSADPNSGYMIFYTGPETGTTGWQSIGGTSAAAPLWAALVALADQNCSCSLGSINPALYNIAAAGAGSFNDIKVGNNDYLGAHGGAYPATTGYDMASGLGTPIASTLVTLLGPQPQAPSFTASTPPTPAAVKSPYSYTFKATGHPQATFSVASGSPPAGLTLNATTGVLAGTPTATGTSTFTVAASNGVGSPAVTASIALTINQATFTNPTDGQANVDTTQPLTWSTIPEAQGYIVVVGTTLYGADLANSGVLSPATASFSIGALPVGPTLYATLLSEVNGGWASFQSITFTAAAGMATFTAPLNGQPNADPTAPFTWATIPQAQGYILVAGTTPYGSNLVNSGVLPATQSTYPGAGGALPAGQTIYATLLTKVNGAFTRFQAITFTVRPALGAFTRPVNGQLAVATPSTFTWSTVQGSQNYLLVVGTTVYGSDLVNSGVLPASQSSFAVPKLPAGKVLYATLLTLVNGAWKFQVVGFIAS
jgi:subtilase family serine protease